MRHTREIKVVGVTFENEDGTKRQDILAAHADDYRTVCILEAYRYNGDPAYAVLCSDGRIGNVPATIAQELAREEQEGATLRVKELRIYGGLEEDFPDKSYSAEITVEIDTGEKPTIETEHRKPIATKPKSGDVILKPWGLKAFAGVVFLCAGFAMLFCLVDSFLWCGLGMMLWFWALGIWLFSGGILTMLDNRELERSPDPAALFAEQRQRPKSLLDRWWVWVVALMAVCMIGAGLDVKTGTRQTDAPAQAEAVEAEPEADALEIPDPVSYSGRGDDYFELEPFDGLYYFEISGNSGEAHFAVKGYDAAGNYTELFVNTTEYYKGYVLDPGQDTRYLEINCEDNWSVRIMSIYTCPVLEAGETYNSEGDDVLLLPGDCQKADIRGNSGEAHFAVETYGRGHDLLVNTTNAYEGTVRVDPEATIMTIDAEGKWAVTVY